MKVLLFLIFAVAVVPAQANERLSASPLSYLSSGIESMPWVRDPFFSRPMRLEVSGLISGEGAFIDGNWVRIGENTGNFRLMEVHENKVIVRRGKEIFSLNIAE